MQNFVNPENVARFEYVEASRICSLFMNEEWNND